MNNAPFYVGQEVVCVEAGYKKNGLGNKNHGNGLIEGNIYVVEEVIPPFVKEWGVVVSGVKSFHWTGGFLASRFRPLQRHPGVEIAEELKDSEKWVRERVEETQEQFVTESVKQN